MDISSDSVIDWRATTELALAPASAPPAGATPPTESGDVAEDDGFRLFGNDGFTFLDFLDIINPLQHIPVIGTLYREMTGDEIDPASRVLGDTLFFGPIGTVASVANVLIENDTGKDIGEHVMAFFQDEDGTPEAADAGTGPVLADAALRQGFQPTSATAPDPAQGSAVDPVTAWAMSEMAYRQSVVDKARVSANGKATSPTAAAPAARAGIDWQKIQATAAITQDMRHAQRVAAAAGYGMQRPQTDDKGETKARHAGAGVPDGAIAADGGWFTDTMLSALSRYKTGAQQDGGTSPHLLDLRQ